jgi:hypothetical protein
MSFAASSAAHEALALETSPRGLCLERAQGMGVDEASILEANPLPRLELLEV